MAPSPASRPLIRAYVDETGDRGCSGNSSPYFAFAAVAIADEDDGLLRAAVSALRRDLKVPIGRPLHWKDHAKVYPRRQHVATTLAAIPRIAVNYVVVEKAAIPAAAMMRGDQEIFYNYAAGIMMERLLLTAKFWPGGSRDVLVRFGHVRGFNHGTTVSYFRIKKTQAPGWIPWSHLRGSVLFDGMGNWDGLQAADQYAGILSAALRADAFGGYEEHHLMTIRHQIRRESNGRSWGYGFKWLGNAATIQSLPWWPHDGL